jgi:hypothetical protein
MAFVTPKPGGWNAQEKLTSLQMNSLQANIVTADAAVLALIAAQQADAVVQRMRHLASRALSLRQITRAGVAITDTVGQMTAIQTDRIVPAMALKIGNTMLCDDADRFEVGTAVSSITSGVADSANNGTRVAVIGTGGTFGCVTTNNANGAWSAFGAGIAAAQKRIIYNPVQAKFIACGGLSSIVYRSTSATTAWTAATASGVNVDEVACLANGNTVFSGVVSSAPAFAISTDGGATFSAPTGGIPNSPTSKCSLVGNGGPLVYQDSVLTGDLSHQICSSPDGLNWTVLATLTIPGGFNIAATPRLLMCQNTGLLVLAAPVGNVGVTMTALFASDDLGLTWCSPRFVAIGPSAFALAGGRLFATDDNMLFASAGIGWS